MGATVEPRFSEGVSFAAPYIDQHYDPQTPIKLVDGWLDVPSRPGLGINPDRTLWGAPVYSFC